MRCKRKHSKDLHSPQNKSDKLVQDADESRQQQMLNFDIVHLMHLSYGHKHISERYVLNVNLLRLTNKRLMGARASNHLN